jgi:hypothetical protein
MPAPGQGHRTWPAELKKTVEMVDLSAADLADTGPLGLCMQPAATQCRSEPADDRHRNATLGVPRIDPVGQAFELGREKLLILGEGCGETLQVATNPGGVSFQRRQHTVTYQVAKVTMVKVRAVLTPPDLPLLEPADKVAVPPGKQRPDDPRSGPGGDTGQPPGTGTTQELQHDPFSNIVTLVTGGDRGRPAMPGEIEKGLVAQAAPGCLSTLRSRIGRQSEVVKRQAELSAQPVTEGRIVVSLLPAGAMMDVGDLEREAEVRAVEEV